MNKTIIYSTVNKPEELKKREIVSFLHESLEQYGDPEEHILKAIDYSLKEFGSFGGFTIIVKDDEILKGAAVVNQTGMGGYIPENILVYIATHKDFRGEGVGKLLMNAIIEVTKGDIALHVEANNPAIALYEKYGFTNPYLEMRLKK